MVQALCEPRSDSLTMLLISFYSILYIPSSRCNVVIPYLSAHSSCDQPNWGIYAKHFLPTSIPAHDLTHLAYAFASIDTSSGAITLSDPWADVEIKHPDLDQGSQGLAGNFASFARIKHHHRHLKLLLSVGGWSYRDRWACLVGDGGKDTEARGRREEFVRSAVGLVEDLGLDGIDVSRVEKLSLFLPCMKSVRRQRRRGEASVQDGVAGRHARNTSGHGMFPRGVFTYFSDGNSLSGQRWRCSSSHALSFQSPADIASIHLPLLPCPPSLSQLVVFMN